MLRFETPPEWAQYVLQWPVELLIDHAFLEKKAANNAMEMMTRWPGDWQPDWVQVMTSVARDEAAHLAQVTRLILRRGGRMERVHKNAYANDLRRLVRKGGHGEVLDRLFVAALIEARSCERFGLLAESARDEELAGLYRSLYASEAGHYRLFVKLARVIGGERVADERWEEMLDAEARVIARQEPGPRIHSGMPPA